MKISERVPACCGRSLLPPSKAEALTTGLNLMRLLVQNRIAEFHTELELLPAEARPRTHRCRTSLLHDHNPVQKPTTVHVCQIENNNQPISAWLVMQCNKFVWIARTGKSHA